MNILLSGEFDANELDAWHRCLHAALPEATWLNRAQAVAVADSVAVAVVANPPPGSLQGLPRRITLDFGDVFSSGLAFDSVASKLTVQDGLMRTERLQIDGPSARVIMRGEVDLEKETQRLNVNVQPEMGGTAALGVALVNPVAGVATWVAHKVLQNPLNQIFGFEYLVTGTWDDPKVDKVSRNDPATGQHAPAVSGAKEEGAGNESASK